MHLLGRNLRDHKPLKIAIRAFFGISHSVAARLLPRLGIHAEAGVADLTEPQLTALSAYLSSPSTSPRPSDSPLRLAPPGGRTLPPVGHPAITGQALKDVVPEGSVARGKKREDPLDELLIEQEKKSQVRADLLHLRQTGTYRGRRHAAGYPARGQRTSTNASTARKLNRVNRHMFGDYAVTRMTMPSALPSPPSLLSLLAGRKQ
ncbi:hypothetical protein IAT38_004205 [Cryptococcus sp. DSM 104549]